MARLLQFLVTAVSLLIVIQSGRDLPDFVASHFDIAGHPDSYLPRATFLAISTLLVCGIPQLVTWLVVRSVRHRGFHIPNASYWLAPERIDETERYVERAATVLGAALAAFLLFCHLQVVLANRAAGTPTLAPALTSVLVALGLFIGAISVGLAIIGRHFRSD